MCDEVQLPAECARCVQWMVTWYRHMIQTVASRMNLDHLEGRRMERARQNHVVLDRNLHQITSILMTTRFAASHVARNMFLLNLFPFLINFMPPPTDRCVGGVMFSSCPSVRPSGRASC